MRSKLAVAAWIVMAALALTVAACGGSDEGDKAAGSTQGSQPAGLRKGASMRLLVMIIGPQPVQDLPA